MRTIIFLFVLACLFSSCKRCPTLVLLPNANPCFLEIHSGDTAAVYLPNGITPNGDGTNDIYKVFGRNIASIQCSIYQGNSLVNQINSLNGSWDGTVNGKTSIQLYTVRVTGSTIWGSQFTLNGTLSSITGPILGLNNPPATQNVLVNYTYAQFPDQNRNGLFDPNRPNGEYVVQEEVVVCR